MNDSELIRLAAKAAGINLDDSGLIPGYYSYFRGLPQWNEWNPLTDDGDALRLAVKLNFEVDICETSTAVRSPIGLKVLVDTREQSDAYAATRRAIVVAAAEIGRRK